MGGWTGLVEGVARERERGVAGVVSGSTLSVERQINDKDVSARTILVSFVWYQGFVRIKTAAGTCSPSRDLGIRSKAATRSMWEPRGEVLQPVWARRCMVQVGEKWGSSLSSPVKVGKGCPIRDLDVAE